MVLESIRNFLLKGIYCYFLIILIIKLYSLILSFLYKFSAIVSHYCQLYLLNSEKNSDSVTNIPDFNLNRVAFVFYLIIKLMILTLSRSNSCRK